MEKIKFSDVFSVEYLSIVTKYKDRIQEMFANYDVIFFMARKAICFYKAMVANGEIVPNASCSVLSSRVLSYNIIDEYRGKKIAIVDDVVVKGKSISRSKEIFEEKNIDVDIHIVACEKEFIDNINFIESIKSPFIYLSDINIYQLSNYITEYIEASMIPYNIDQPIYNINFLDKETYNSIWLKMNNTTNIADGLQRARGIESFSIHFKPQVLNMLCGTNLDDNSIFLKIRFLRYRDSLELMAIPFVLLPEMSYKKLDEIFSIFFDMEISYFIHNKNSKEEYENKLKLLQYFLSNILFWGFVKNLKLESIMKDIENEYIQFSKEIFDLNFMEKFKDIKLDLTYNEQVRGVASFFELDRYLSDAYDFIFSCYSDRSYYDAKSNLLEQNIITFSGLISYIGRTEKRNINYEVSSIVDILIDKGILIPSIVHGDESIIRGYKYGEIYKLTSKEIELFAYMLGQYVEVMEGRGLDKIEVEKLFVLFFKNAAYRNRLFTIAKTYDEDYFSICYSKFGPRVSNSDKKYKTDTQSTLVAILKDKGELIIGENGKYKIYNTIQPKARTWQIIANNFSLSYFYLYQCFKDDKPIKNVYIHSYNDFLTLLSIGPDLKNQMYSLIAELYLMKNIDMNMSLEKILYQLGHYSEGTNKKYFGIMDGIASGMWKYVCYCKLDLVDSIFECATKKRNEIRYIQEEYWTGACENDENPIYKDMLEQCGQLIFEIAYLYNYAYKYILRKQQEEMNIVFKKAVFFNDKFVSMRHGIKKMCEFSTEEQIVNLFKILKKRSLALVNKCDLCIEDAALRNMHFFKDVYVLYHPESNFEKKGEEINFQNSNLNTFLGKCIFLPKRDSIEKQVSELIKKYSLNLNSALIIYMNMEEVYEGVIGNYHIATGDFFKNLTLSVIKESNYHPDESINKLIICTKNELDEKDIQYKAFELKFDYSFEMYDGYRCAQYEIHIKEIDDMSNNTFNFRDININGNVGELIMGGNSYKSITDEKRIDKLFEEIEMINEELLSEDSNALTLIQEIKNEAIKKNEENVLEKLKKLALSVGNSVFVRVVSSYIIEVMKLNNVFPF